MSLGKKKMLHQAAAGGVVNTDNFAPVTYTGNGGTQSISSLDFQPDLVWIKKRQNDTKSHRLFDSVRGANNVIYSNASNAAATPTDELTSFDSNGFTVGAASAVNDSDSADSFVAWCWKAGGAAVSDTTTGDIDADISANTAAGFSIVKYIGNSSTNQTIPHGLDSAPELIIIKNLDDSTANWLVAGENINYYLNLNRTDADPSSSSYNWITNRGATTFTVGSQRKEINQPNEDFIAYCFHSVDGYQKVGSYAGSTTNDVEVTLGFAPRFLIIKAAVGGGGNWFIYDSVRDTTNPNNTFLNANLNNTEAVNNSYRVDFDANGFTVYGGSDNQINYDNRTYIYLAIA